MFRDQATLLDIAHASRRILEFTAATTQEQFLDDSKTQSAVLYQLLVIGEAVKRLSPAFRAQHSHIPWSLRAGMRDHLIHGYDVVDWDEVWYTVQRDIPALLDALKDLLPRGPAAP